MLILWLCLIGLTLAGAAAARKTPVPEAVILCTLGIAAGFVPQLSRLRFDPEIALYLLLPPLVYSAAVRLPWPEFRDNLRPIGALAIGLVLASTAAAAAIGHMLEGLPWAVAIALGAVVSPTDPVAASAVASRTGLPRKVAAILEGEGLVNDAVALTLLHVALGAAAGHGFLPVSGVLRFTAIVIGEPLYGWALGAGIARLRSRIWDSRMEVTVSLLTPFAAYLVPERLGGSGILATVAAGMYIGERSATLVPAGTRLHATSFWDMLEFLVNGVLFLMAGMELRRVIGLGYHGARLLFWAVAIAAAVAAARAAWCAAAWSISHGLASRQGGDRRPMPARHMAVIGWSGMRGPISLAAALSIPASAGARIPQFETVVFITAGVIVLTLGVQGTVLPALVHLLGLDQDAARERRAFLEQESMARKESAVAAMARLNELAAGVSRQTLDRLRLFYQTRQDGARAADTRLRSELIDAERAKVLELRNEGRISDHALQKLERSLDLRQSEVDAESEDAGE